MSISGVSSTSVIPQTASQNSGNLLRQTFKQLASSLQSGELAGAQKALSAVESPLQSNQFTSRSPAIESISTRKSTIQNDVAAVGKALNFGDLSAAQSNFSRLVKDLQPAGQDSATGQSIASVLRHAHRHLSGASDSDSDATPSGTAVSTVAASSQNFTGVSISLYA